MEDLDPCGGERSTHHEFEYVLWVAICLVISVVIPGDVGEGVPKTPYLGAGYRGSGTGGRNGIFGVDDHLILKS